MTQIEYFIKYFKGNNYASLKESLNMTLYLCYYLRLNEKKYRDELSTRLENIFDDFLKVDMRVGTVLNAKVNEKAKKPAYILEVDFGKEIGIKTTSAQITDKYSLDELIGMKVVGVVNFPPKQIADVKSEFLIIGSYSEGGVTLLSPNKDAQNGDKIG